MKLQVITLVLLAIACALAYYLMYARTTCDFEVNINDSRLCIKGAE